MGKGKKKKGFLGDIIALFLIAIFLVVFFKTAGINSFEDVWEYAKSKVPAFKHCLATGECGQDKLKPFFQKKNYNIDFGKPLNLPDFSGEKGLKAAKTVVDDLPVATFDSSGTYNRGEWKHWKNTEGSSCWNVREEILYTSGSNVQLLDQRKEETRRKEDACYITAGAWQDPYSGKTIDDPRKIDIDHIVPLAYAEGMGAKDWTPEQRETFANDYDNLTISSSSENRQKGASGPGEWMPSNQRYHCEYAKRFIAVVKKYGLSVTEKDKNALGKALALCP